MPKSNGDIVRDFFEIIWNQRRPDRIDEFLTPTSVLHADEGDVVGAAGFLAKQYTPFSSAFPDLKVTIQGVIEQGAEVVAHWTAIGTHLGDGLGFPATGKTASFRGITWIQHREGKFAEGWQSANIEEVIRRLAS